MSKQSAPTLAAECFLCNHAIIDGECLCTVIDSDELYEGHRPPTRITADHYTFPSWSDGPDYHIERNEYGVWMCGCPGYARHFHCKHAPWFAKWLRSLESIATLKRTRRMAEMLGDIEPPARRKVTLESLYEDVA